MALAITDIKITSDAVPAYAEFRGHSAADAAARGSCATATGPARSRAIAAGCSTATRRSAP